MSELVQLLLVAPHATPGVVDGASIIDRTGCAAERHGDEKAYAGARCRCPDAREKRRIYRKRLREGRHIPQFVDSTGSANRLRALYAIGYHWAALAQHLGRSRRWVRDVANRAHPTVTLTTERAVRALYERLSGKPAPPAPVNTRARVSADRRGWWTPQQWEVWGDAIEYVNQAGDEQTNDVEQVLVRRVLYGQAPYTALRNDAERSELWRAWRRYRDEYGLDGPGVPDFSKRYGVDLNDVKRLRGAAEPHGTRSRPRTPTKTAVDRDRATERTAA